MVRTKYVQTLTLFFYHTYIRPKARLKNKQILLYAPYFSEYLAFIQSVFQKIRVVFFAHFIYKVYEILGVYIGFMVSKLKPH